jgi:hypothetical protein
MSKLDWDLGTNSFLEILLPLHRDLHLRLLMKLGHKM